MRLVAFLAIRRERRARMQRDASDLLTFLGDMAYSEARDRARVCRRGGDRAGDRHWSRVAVEIASRTGHVIGEATADRYEAGAKLSARERADRAEVISGLVDIAHGIADLSHGRGNATTLHNIRARVLRLAEIGRSTTAEEAGRELYRACEALAAVPAENAASLASGMYPPAAETAGQALQRFRNAVQG